MARVYVGNLDPRATDRDLEDDFGKFGRLKSVWVARKPPGFAFIEFDDVRDAEDAVRDLNGKSGWRVEISRSGGPGGGRGGGGGGGFGGGGGGDGERRCYECGQPGHFARECRLRGGTGTYNGGGGGRDGGRDRSRSPRRRDSPRYGGDKRDDSPPPRRRDDSPPPRRRSRDVSPPRAGRERERD